MRVLTEAPSYQLYCRDCVQKMSDSDSVLDAGCSVGGSSFAELMNPDYQKVEAEAGKEAAEQLRGFHAVHAGHEIGVLPQNDSAFQLLYGEKQ